LISGSREVGNGSEGRSWAPDGGPPCGSCALAVDPLTPSAGTSVAAKEITQRVLANLVIDFSFFGIEGKFIE
jgi:hypothetical protein